jgi:hypothetical protein
MPENAYCCASLQVVLPNRISIVHSIEGGNLIHAHWRHLQQPCDLIHNAQAAESMLSLPEIQQGHHGCLFVLRWIAFQDLIDELVVLFCELEGNAGVVLGGISMLESKLSVAERLLWRSFELKGDVRPAEHRWQLSGSL